MPCEIKQLNWLFSFYYIFSSTNAESLCQTIFSFENAPNYSCQRSWRGGHGISHIWVCSQPFNSVLILAHYFLSRIIFVLRIMSEKKLYWILKIPSGYNICFYMNFKFQLLLSIPPLYFKVSSDKLPFILDLVMLRCSISAKGFPEQRKNSLKSMALASKCEVGLSSVYSSDRLIMILLALIQG